MSMIEFMFKYDKAFYMENNFDMIRVMNNGANGIWFTVFLPLKVSITGLFSFGDTMQGFWRLEYNRGSKRSYRIRNFFNICGVGAMGVTLGYLLYTLAVIPFFPYYTPLVIPPHDGLPEEIINSPLTSLEFLGNIFSKLGILFLFSFLTSEICLCIFLASKYRYIAVGIPLICFYLLINISNSLSVKSLDARMYYVSPTAMVAGSAYTFRQAFNMSFGWLLLAELLVIAGLYVLYMKLLDWRLKR